MAEARGPELVNGRGCPSAICCLYFSLQYWRRWPAHRGYRRGLHVIPAWYRSSGGGRRVETLGRTW